MTATTKAFHELILQANRAHKAYNTHGQAAGLHALACLLEHLQALAHHIQHEKERPGDQGA